MQSGSFETATWVNRWSTPPSGKWSSIVDRSRLGWLSYGMSRCWSLWRSSWRPGPTNRTASSRAIGMGLPPVMGVRESARKATFLSRRRYSMNHHRSSMRSPRCLRKGPSSARSRRRLRIRISSTPRNHSSPPTLVMRSRLDPAESPETAVRVDDGGRPPKVGRIGSGFRRLGGPRKA